LAVTVTEWEMEGKEPFVLVTRGVFEDAVVWARARCPVGEDDDDPLTGDVLEGFFASPLITASNCADFLDTLGVSPSSCLTTPEELVPGWA
jgi:hypothetical protein